jgi:hypothetical protein
MWVAPNPTTDEKAWSFILALISRASETAPGYTENTNTGSSTSAALSYNFIFFTARDYSFRIQI